MFGLTCYIATILFAGSVTLESVWDKWRRGDEITAGEKLAACYFLAAIFVLVAIQKIN